MIINPELRRNLWLEITHTRLIVMPIVLGSIFALLYLASADADLIGSITIVIYIALTFFWGARLASESIFAEVRERTWDAQRLSSISPWTMTWGKLFGSTAYAWYGGVFCLAVFIWQVRFDNDWYKTVLILILGALLVQTLALFSSMHMIIKSKVISRSQSAAVPLLAIAAMIPFLIIGVSTKVTNFTFFQYSFASIDFSLASLIAFLIWALWGVERLMRAELKYRKMPIAWAGFLLFLIAYIAGFDFSEAINDFNKNLSTLSSWLIAFLTGIGITWLTILAEKKDPIAWQRLWQRVKEHNYRRAIESLPAWSISLFVAIFAAIILSILLLSMTIIDNTPLIIINLVLFLCRDVALVIWLNLSENQRRADVFAVIWLLLIYTIFPMLFKTIGLTAVAACFRVETTDYALVSMFAALLECIALGYLINRRWQRWKNKKILIQLHN
ncbi:MAG: hypothetical protein JW841_07305 [Deltaproteobacteria bacterium]|nr:hypothetical protein [Deltaproteobacteria bacterium]